MCDATPVQRPPTGSRAVSAPGRSVATGQVQDQSRELFGLPGPRWKRSSALVDVEGVRPNTPCVDVQEREPVSAGKGRPGIDVEAVRVPLHGVHDEVPVHDRLEAVLDPHERLRRVRSATDQVADAEEAVAPRIEAKRGERPLESAEAPVDVADDDVAPARVGGDSPDAAVFRGGRRHPSVPDARY